MRYLKKFNESLIGDKANDKIRIAGNVKDIFVGYQDSHDLDVDIETFAPGLGLPSTLMHLDDNVLMVKLFAQRGIRYDDISGEIDMLIDYMKSLTDKEVRIYSRLDKHVLSHWSGGFSGSHNTLELFFVECVTPLRKIAAVHSGSLDYSKTNESLDSKIVDDIEDIFVEMHDSGLNYLVSKEGQDISIGIYRHRTMSAVIDLELLKDCVEMTRDYLSGLGDFTEFYRFGYVWNTDSQDSLRGLDSSKSRNTLEYNSFPTNLEEDLRNQTFISSYQGDFYYEINGVKIVFKKK
jgi:hypothetical protein